MKTTHIFLLASLVLVAGLVTAPATHARSTGESCPAPAATIGEAPEPVETARKAPIDLELEAQSCTIYLTCPAGDQIACSNANNDCSSGNYWVECGGNRTYCPPCLASTECKYGKPPVSCWSQVGDCHVDYLFGVSCDGTYYPCGQSPAQ